MNRISLFWGALPVILRAVVAGMAVQIAGVASFAVLAQLNLAYGRSVPWALPLEVVVLWIMYWYLDGGGWPSSTSSGRRHHLGARRIPTALVPATVVSGVALGFTIVFQVVFAYRLVAMPEAAGGALLGMLDAPPVTAVGLMLAGVAMTGFVEEAAFRGYMQRPIEDRHGPLVAIVLVAVLFAAVHGPPPILLPLFVLGALGWGVYARLAGSTVPGMIVHGLVDAMIFAWIMVRPEVVTDMLQADAVTDGFDRTTIVAGVSAVATATLTVVGFIWMARVRARTEAAAHRADEIEP